MGSALPMYSAENAQSEMPLSLRIESVSVAVEYGTLISDGGSCAGWSALSTVRVACPDTVS